MNPPDVAAQPWLPTAGDVVEASLRIAGRIHRTPVLRSSTIDRLTGRSVYLKAEHLQKTGSYKARGAVNQILYLSERDQIGPAGVVAASSGNHGQAVAWAAREAQIKATIVVPTTIAGSKLAAIRSYGARVIEVSSDSDERLRVAHELSARDGLVNIPPYDHPVTIAGQGTCIYETVEQIPEEIEGVVVPVSGGGLAAGSILAVRARHSGAAVYAAEPAGADDTRRSFREGRRVQVAPETIADALRAQQPGELTFEINKTGLRDVVCVSDAEIAATMRLLWERAKQVVEPGGAVGLAAVLAGAIPGKAAVVVVLSGGNVDMDLIQAPWWSDLRTGPGAGNI